MASKMKTLTVAFDIEGNEFIVHKASNSTEYLPGKRVNKKTIDNLCAAKDWKVDFIHISKLG